MSLKTLLVPSAFALMMALSACGGETTTANTEETVVAGPERPEITLDPAELEGNPLVAEWDTPYSAPPFSEITEAHYMPAMKAAVLELRGEVDAVIANPDEPTFENTILALEKSGKLLWQVALTFSNISGTESNDEIRALESEI